MEAKRLLDDLRHRKAGVQRSVRILKDDLHLTTDGDHVLFGKGAQIHPLKNNVAGGCLMQPKQHTAKR